LASEYWPPNAITVLIELRTSSAIAPAMPYASISFFASLDEITLTVPTAIKVIGSDERQTRASSQPFVRANIKEPTNDAIKCIN